MKAMNSVALPIIGLVKQTATRLGGWKGPVDFVVVKMEDFDVPNEFKMISAMQLDKSPIKEEPPSTAILLGTLRKLGETVPKDTLHYQVRATKTEGLEATCVTRLRAYEFPVAPFNLTDTKGGKGCFVKRQINVLGHVVEFHQIEEGKKKIVATFLQRGTSSLTELFKEEDIQWGENLKCQAAFNGLKQAMVEGPSLGVANVTKPPKVEAEQFNYMLGEYLHHFVDGRQKNWVQLPNVSQFGYSAQDKFANQEKRSFKADGGEVDQKRCPIEFEWMTKLSINDKTTPCDYLSTWNRKNIEESKKSLLAESNLYDDWPRSRVGKLKKMDPKAYLRNFSIELKDIVVFKMELGLTRGRSRARVGT
ncbi:uncharacterized protein E5676_scaffold1032G00090 [Cucumis melo var. makuwa]|uniref:Uncharacterized protein n=1 Tax=Cucumis melo var. makuwa TaxID=1194695 RepID=A0A5A7SRU0_CUCMM|nr:uncharacterized protein E6C27_scaffold269G002970 [Cucumis melo var. makuwa]TYK17081.1 uncharacterized protein E5676_scaffold1032G00090 [Cucumis melo var. makuwa]